MNWLISEGIPPSAGKSCPIQGITEGSMAVDKGRLYQKHVGPQAHRKAIFNIMEFDLKLNRLLLCQDHIFSQFF